MSNIFYHSDWHLNHEFVARTRGFATAAEHDEWLIDNINSTVGKRDQIWMLGDLTMGSLTTALADVSKVNATMHLVLGNHDAAHPMHSRSSSQVRRYLDVFATVSMHEQHSFADHKVMLSHFPYSGDHKEEDRYTEFGGCATPGGTFFTATFTRSGRRGGGSLTWAWTSTLNLFRARKSRP